MPTSDYRYLSGRLAVHAEKLVELEDSVNEAYVQIAEVDSRNKVKELEEKLDSMTKTLDMFFTQDRERLDKLEASYSSKVWNIKLEERLRKLEGIVETILAVHGVKR